MLHTAVLESLALHLLMHVPVAAEAPLHVAAGGSHKGLATEAGEATRETPVPALHGRRRLHELAAGSRCQDEGQHIEEAHGSIWWQPRCPSLCVITGPVL